MCTGDNLRTAVCVGRECSMIPDDADLYLVTAELGENGSLAVQYTLEVGHFRGRSLAVQYTLEVGHFRGRSLAVQHTLEVGV